MSVIWAPDQKEAGIRLFALFEMVLVYVAIIVANFDALGFVRIIKCYVLSAVLPVMFSLWQLANNLFKFSSSSLPFISYLIPEKYMVLEATYFHAGLGFSRLSSTFAEPNIFGGYLCSVLLLSLLLVAKNTISIVVLRMFQILLFFIIVLTISKSALISLFIGVFIISIKLKRFKDLLVYVLILFLIMFGVMMYSGYFSIFGRFLSTTGHPEYISARMLELLQHNYLIGVGIGSISNNSTHIFVLSRIYETGFIGLLFSILVTLIPLNIYRLKSENYNSYTMKIVFTGVSLALVFGLYVYDYFVHMFTWVVIGLVMSFYNSERKRNLAVISKNHGI
jgi:hypothetical protein